VLEGPFQNGPCMVISVVPQDNVLSPLLFIIYNNDLSDQIQSSLWVFADDTKI